MGLYQMDCASLPVSASGIDRCVGSAQHDLFRARTLAPVCIQLGEVDSYLERREEASESP